MEETKAIENQNLLNNGKMLKKFESAYGYFSEDGKEYVITTSFTPRPWGNIISNGDYGMMISQNGSGYSWRGNAGQNRLRVDFKT